MHPSDHLVHRAIEGELQIVLCRAFESGSFTAGSGTGPPPSFFVEDGTRDIPEIFRLRGVDNPMLVVVKRENVGMRLSSGHFEVAV